MEGSTAPGTCGMRVFAFPAHRSDRSNLHYLNPGRGSILSTIGNVLFLGDACCGQWLPIAKVRRRRSAPAAAGLGRTAAMGRRLAGAASGRLFPVRSGFSPDNDCASYLRFPASAGPACIVPRISLRFRSSSAGHKAAGTPEWGVIIQPREAKGSCRRKRMLQAPGRAHARLSAVCCAVRQRP